MAAVRIIPFDRLLQFVPFRLRRLMCARRQLEIGGPANTSRGVSTRAAVIGGETPGLIFSSNRPTTGPHGFPCGPSLYDRPNDSISATACLAHVWGVHCRRVCIRILTPRFVVWWGPLISLKFVPISERRISVPGHLPPHKQTAVPVRIAAKAHGAAATRPRRRGERSEGQCPILALADRRIKRII